MQYKILPFAQQLLFISTNLKPRMRTTHVNKQKYKKMRHAVPEPYYHFNFLFVLQLVFIFQSSIKRRRTVVIKVRNNLAVYTLMVMHDLILKRKFCFLTEVCIIKNVSSLTKQDSLKLFIFGMYNTFECIWPINVILHKPNEKKTLY